MSSGSQSSTSTPTEPVVRRKSSGRTGLYVAIAVIVVIVVVLAGGYAAGWFKASSTAKSACAAPGAAPAFVPTSVASSTPTVAPAAGQTLNGAGSTLVAPLMYAWSLDYTNNSVNYASVGSGAGIQDITQKTVDFGASDAPLNPTQRAAIPSPGVVTIPESAGAAVPVYNLPVSATLKFTGAILASIYLGDITNWNNSALQAVNPGVTLPNACIIVVHRSDGSGTTFVWTSYLSQENTTWKNTVGFATSVNWPVGVGSKGNSGVTGTVKSTSDAIGYVDINYALTNGVAFGAVENPSGNYILANITNIASAIKDANPTSAERDRRLVQRIRAERARSSRLPPGHLHVRLRVHGRGRCLRFVLHVDQGRSPGGFPSLDGHGRTELLRRAVLHSPLAVCCERGPNHHRYDQVQRSGDPLAGPVTE